MKILNTFLFVTAASTLASSALAVPAQDDCTDIANFVTFGGGDVLMDNGDWHADDYFFRFACGDGESEPQCGDTGMNGYMWYQDASSENMAFSWSIADATLTGEGFELSSFSYALGRYTGLPWHHYGNGYAFSSAFAVIEVTQPTTMTLTMEVDSDPFHYVDIEWERALERVEWQDHGEQGAFYFPIETIAHDKYQNFVRAWNDYDQYVVGQTSDRVITIELEPGFYGVSTRTKVRANAEFYGIVGTVDHFVRSTCNVQFECIQRSSADLNNDYKVDGEDMAIMLGAWGTSSQQADLDESGIVDGADLTILLGDWD